MLMTRQEIIYAHQVAQEHIDLEIILLLVVLIYVLLPMKPSEIAMLINVSTHVLMDILLKLILTVDVLQYAKVELGEI